MKFQVPNSILKLCCLLAFASGVLGEYNVSYDFQNPERLPYRIEAATFVRDNTLYSYGGRKRDGEMMNSFDGFYLDSDTGELVHKIIGIEDTPASAGSAAVLLPDNNKVLFFGGNQSTSADSLQNGSMLVMEYDFATGAWTARPVFSGNALPTNTESPTAALAPNGNVYIYGGAYTNSTEDIELRMATGVMWVYDPKTNLFSSVEVSRDVSEAFLGVPTVLP